MTTPPPASGSELDVAVANVTAAAIGAVMRGATVEQISDAANAGVRLGRRANHERRTAG